MNHFRPNYPAHEPLAPKRGRTPERGRDEIVDDAEVAVAVPVEIVLAQGPGAVASDVGARAAEVASTPGVGVSGAVVAAPAASSGWLATAGLGLTVGLAAQRSRADDAPDRAAPTLVISDNVAAGYATDAVVFSFDFSEPVSGFTLDDIVVSGGAKRQLSGSGAHYTLTVTPANGAVGNLTVAVAADAARDDAGNISLPARAEQPFDTQAPTLVISNDYAGPTAAPITFTFHFSEPVSGFTADDLVFDGGVPGPLTGDGTTYQVVMTPEDGNRVFMAVATGGVADGARNLNENLTNSVVERYRSVYSVKSGVVEASGLLDEKRLAHSVMVLVEPDRISRLDYYGNPDEYFAADGALELAPGEGVAFPLGVTPTGFFNTKTLVVGTEKNGYSDNESLMLARYNSDGSRDTAFGDNGLAIQRFSGQVYEFRQWIVQPDGKALVAGFVGNGYWDQTLTISRFNADGFLDSGFSGDGTVTIENAWRYGDWLDMALLGDGRVLLLTDTALTRLNADGSLDDTFAGDGTLEFSGFDNVPQNDGSVVWVRRDVERPAAIVLLGDGDVVVAGTSFGTYGGGGWESGEFSLARYNVDGSRDLDFSDDGPIMTPLAPFGAHAVAVASQADGKLLVAGNAAFYDPVDLNPRYPRAVVVRYNADGSLDPGFSRDGRVFTDFFAGPSYPDNVFQQADGKVVVEGMYEDMHTRQRSRAVARFNADGTPDTSFFGDGVLSDDLPWLTSPVYHPLRDGGFLLQGSNDQGKGVLARFNADGRLDHDFGMPPKAVLDPAGLAASATQAQRVHGFVDGTDHLLLSRLSYEQLTIADGTGSEAGNVIVGTGGQYLAVLMGMTAQQITAADFVVI